MEKLIKQSFRVITSITAFLLLNACNIGPSSRIPIELLLRHAIHKSYAIVSSDQDWVRYITLM